jgi:predicted N-acetyltransferase YhbS
MDFKVDQPISPDQFIDVLRRSTLAERRPVDDIERIQGMLAHADLLITAWDGDVLVGVARSVTDFSYCCYLSDLAVDSEYQRQGVGRELIRRTKNQLHPACTLILLAAPDARNYYPHIGFRQHQSAWILPSADQIK